MTQNHKPTGIPMPGLPPTVNAEHLATLCAQAGLSPQFALNLIRSAPTPAQAADAIREESARGAVALVRTRTIETMAAAMNQPRIGSILAKAPCTAEQAKAVLLAVADAIRVGVAASGPFHTK